METKVFEGEEYLDAGATMDLIGVSPTRFYQPGGRFRTELTFRQFDGRLRKWYLKQAVLEFMSGRNKSVASIPLRGPFSSWEQYVFEFHGGTSTLLEVNEGPLPKGYERLFPGTGKEMEFLIRTKGTEIEGIPVCFWETYYPKSLLGELDPKQQGHLSETLLKQYPAHHAIEQTWGREMNGEEMNRFRARVPDTLLLLDRAVYTEEGMLLWLVHMILLGSRFHLEQRYRLSANGERL